MSKYKTKWFAKRSGKNNLTSVSLSDAPEEFEKGVGVTNLGGGVYKIRMARNGYGKSGGYRAILAFRKSKITVFVYGFSKSERENTDKSELKYLKKLAATFFNLTIKEVNELVYSGELIVIKDFYEKDN